MSQTLSEAEFAEKVKDLDEQIARAKALNDSREAEEAALEELRKLHKSPFSDFVQVNKLNLDFLTDLATAKPTAFEIFVFIIQHMDRYNALVCSYKVFEEWFGISHATVARNVAYLKDHGYICILKSGTTNVYVANDRLVWNSYGNNRKYCKFPSNVLLSKSEQEKFDETKDVDKILRKASKVKKDRTPTVYVERPDPEDIDMDEDPFQ